MRIRVLGVALLVAALSGCWVLDELDEGQKKIEKYSPARPEAVEEEEVAQPSVRKQRVADYFANQKNTRTLTPGSVSGEIVSCKLASGTQFMKRSECSARGGVPR